MNKKITEFIKYRPVKAGITGILGFCGLCRLMNDAGFKSVFTWSLYSIIFFALIVIAEYNLTSLVEKDGDDSRKILRYAYIYGLLFAVAADLGYQFQMTGMTAPGARGKLGILFTGMFLSFAVLPVTYRIFRFIAGLYNCKISNDAPGKKVRSCFLISFVFIQLCWLPAFLAYYPAIMSYDFHRQFAEAVKGYIWFYEYQPLAHTFMIRMAYLLGTKLGSVAAGMAVFVFLQSMLLNASISAGVAYVYKKTGKNAAIFVCLMFALLPFNPVLAISITKDIIFTAVFAFLILLLIRVTEKDSVFAAMLFLLTGIVNILFRNNAVYAMIFMIPVCLVFLKGGKKKIMTAALILVTIAAGMCGKTLIRTTMNAIPGDRIEMFSVPIVQMVRVVKYQEANLTPEQQSILHEYISDESWGTYYVSIADSPKAIASRDRNAQWLDNPGQLLKDYITIGKAYPNDYLDAWIGLTAGYWFIDDRTHAEMLGFGDDSDLGLLYTFNASVNDSFPEGIPSHSYLPGLEKIYSHIVNGNSYYDWPVISQLMKPALYFWIFVLVIFTAFYKRSRKSVIVLTYPVMYFMTMLLGPCVNFRYMYPFIVVVPFLAAFVLSEKDSSSEVTEGKKD